jgi:polyisoprenoid-binding protein YceI
MSDTTTGTVTDLKAGTWTLDPGHTEIGFTVRHLLVSKVHGRFTEFEGAITVAEDKLLSAATITVQMASVDTHQAQRDEHLRTNDFFDIANNPTMTYASTKVTPDGDDYLVDGNLTLRGVTKPVQLQVEFNGVTPDPWGGTRLGFSGKAKINRKDFGVAFDAPIPGSDGAVVGDKIDIFLEVEAVLTEQ